MRTVLLIAYVVMAGWLLVSAILRVLIQLAGDVPLDPLPVISAGVALIALVALRPAVSLWTSGRDHPRERSDSSPAPQFRAADESET